MPGEGHTFLRQSVLDTSRRYLKEKKLQEGSKEKTTESTTSVTPEKN